jgi:hypothetical protein
MTLTIVIGKAFLDLCFVVFDAEALGALRGLQHTARLTDNRQQIHVCTDNTASVWGLRGKASNDVLAALPSLPQDCRHLGKSQYQVESGAHGHLRE